MDYALPASDQVPPIETVILELPSDAGPFGAKGVGEPPVVAAAAAVANAVADATGHRFTELPITSEMVVRALGDGAAAGLTRPAASDQAMRRLGSVRWA
jgi:CO/xanthine dehydrogenase Mo-binding subunit